MRLTGLGNTMAVYLYRISLLLLVLLVPKAIRGESIALQQNTQQHTGTTVYHMLQDNNGYLWFATASGIVQFDGIQSRHFGADEGLLSEFVIAMAQGRGDTLWLGTWGGGLLYYTNDTIQPYSAKQLPHRIKNVLFDKHNRLWVGNPYVLAFLHNHTLTFLHLGTGFGKRGKEQIHALYEDIAGRIFIGTTAGLFCFANGKVRKVDFSPTIDTHAVYSITGDSAGMLWLGCAGRIYQLDSLLHMVSYRDVLPNNEQISTLYTDREHRVWGVGFQSGIFIVDDTSVVRLSASLPLHNTQINTLYEDHEGNMWLGTYGAGGMMLPNFRCSNFTTADGLPNNYVLSMCTNDQGTLFVGTRDGIATIRRDSVRPLSLPFPKQQYGMHYIPALLCDTSGTLWIGINNTVVQYRNRAIAAIDTIHAAKFLYRDTKGRIWVCKSRGVQLHNGTAYTSWKEIPPLAFAHEKTVQVTTMCEDSSGTLWFGTTNGLYTYNGTTYQHYTTADGLPSNTVHNILVQHDTLWIATRKGLCSWHDKQWKYYTQQQGLRSTMCFVLLLDSTEKLWVGTDRGLHRFDGTSFAAYDTHDGLLSNRIHALCNGANGVLWIGTDRGVSKFQTRSINIQSTAPPLFITRLVVDDTAFAHPDSVELPYEDNTLRIDFAALAYRYPNDVHYRYKFGGIDKHWQYTTSRSLHYSAVAPGSYTLMVQARIRQGNWSKPAVLHLTIGTPFWATWWFRGSLLLAAVGSIWVAIHWRMSRARQKQVEYLNTQYRILQLEQKALHALMNPHFVFNALTSIHRYIHSHHDDQAADYLAQFAKLIRMTFESAQHTYVLLSEELQRLELYLSLEQMRFYGKLSYSITIAPDVETDDIFVPSMLLQPYVENAILHGLMPIEGKGHIAVSVAQQGERLLLVVEDNGIGIETARAQRRHGDDGHHSSGMALTEERLKLLAQIAHTDITLRVAQLPTDATGRTGTRVEIVLPTDIASTAALHNAL